MGCGGGGEIGSGMDNKPKVDWLGVMRAIAGTKYEGYVAHEFLPVRV